MSIIESNILYTLQYIKVENKNVNKYFRYTLNVIFFREELKCSYFYHS